MEKDKLPKLMLKASFVCHHAHTYVCMNFNVIEFVLRKSFEWRNKFVGRPGKYVANLFQWGISANVPHVSRNCSVSLLLFFLVIVVVVFIVKCDLRFGFWGQFVALVRGSLFVKEGNYIVHWFSMGMIMGKVSM